MKIILKDGRKWSGGKRATKATRVYQIIADSVGANESLSFAGLPAIGSVHPSLPGIYAESYDFEEGKGAEKGTILVTVNYSASTSEGGGGGGGGGGDDESRVEEWGWEPGTDEKELTTAADGTPVLNSAGDPFDSVPSVSVPAPTFTKIVKFKTRQSCMGMNCRVNKSAVTIGGMSYQPGSLLCTVGEKRLLSSDTEYNYQYTVQLKFKQNLVKIGGEGDLTDIGWDVAITDAGMREIVDDSGRKSLIRVTDEETGKRSVVSSSELLNGSGQAISRSPSGDVPEPYNFRFQAYGRSDFPNWFTSEPPLVNSGTDSKEEKK